MATLAGNGGAVKLGVNTVAEIGEWSLEIDADMQDITAFLSGGVSWKVFMATLRSWSGKFGGRLDQSDTLGQVALQAALLGGTTVSVSFFTVVGGTPHSYVGTAFVKAQSPKATVGGMVEVEFSMQGSGALTYS
jgi:hypothetical protein